MLVIVKYHRKSDSLEVFHLDMSANYGKICCNEIISEVSIMSGSEASLEYYWECTKATNEQVEMAIKALQKIYDEPVIVKQKLTTKYKKEIWR
jgi:hypothetical protein